MHLAQHCAVTTATHDDSGNLVDTLTITARHWYNGVVVVFGCGQLGLMMNHQMNKQINMLLSNNEMLTGLNLSRMTMHFAKLMS